jgi:hypothetical protein
VIGLVTAVEKRSRELLAEHSRHIIELQNLIAENVTADEFNEKIRSLFTNFEARFNDMTESTSKAYVELRKGVTDA